MKKGQLTDMIFDTLREYPETRNDDVTLQLTIIQRYFKDLAFGRYETDQTFYEEQSLRMVREDHVKRIRARIQNSK